MSDYERKLYKDDEVVFEAEVGVGKADRPTPGGVYYIKELLQPPDPNGAYGVYAYGLSGYSEVLESFKGCPGVLGLHCTNRPERICNDVSNGCVSMRHVEISQQVEEYGLQLGHTAHASAHVGPC